MNHNGCQGEIWTFETDYMDIYCLILAENEQRCLVMKLFDESRDENDITIKDADGTKYGCSVMLSYMFHDRKRELIRALTENEYQEIQKILAQRLGIEEPREIVCVPKEEPQDDIKEKLQELRETLEDMEEADGKLSQKKTSRFILRYMDVLGI